MIAAIGLIFTAPTAILAQDFEPFFELDGFADIRAFAADNRASTFQGGFGKARFGGGREDIRLNEIALIGFGQLTPSLSASVHAQYNPDLDTPVDVVEAFVRYRPNSTSRWRWSAKAGAFFPLVSGEQLGVAWENLFTLTNNAANTWIAEEVRPIGLDAQLEYRGDLFRATLSATAFFGNDRSGVGLAFRGWQLNGQNVGLFGEVDLPNLTFGNGRTGAENNPFVESDGRPGFALGLSIDHESHGRVIAYASDNRADPLEVGSEGRLWRTRYASLAYDRFLPGDLELYLQGMIGETYTYPTGVEDGPLLLTSFYTASALLARRFGDFQIALRGELFEQIDRSTTPGPLFGEVGEAVTLAASWFGGETHQISSELLHINARRDGGRNNQPITINETLFQISYRFRF